jgi:hypothetical protein
MSVSVCFRRIVLAVAVLALAGTASAVHAGDWEAVCTYRITEQHGQSYEGTLEAGVAKTGGRFTGTWSSKHGAGGGAGTDVLNFGGGHTLTLDFGYDFIETGGSGFYIVTGGTGKYANATGSGLMEFAYSGDGFSGTIMFVGTLSR